MTQILTYLSQSTIDLARSASRITLGRSASSFDHPLPALTGPVINYGFGDGPFGDTPFGGV